MPRPLVLSNGSLLVAYDRELSIRDLTFPFVGSLNHLFGNPVRIGLWIDGQFAWLSDPAWQRRLAYETDTLVTRCECFHPRLNIGLTVSDAVHPELNVLLRRFELTNHADYEREARLFLSHPFNLCESNMADTAFYHPASDTLIHYKRDIYLLIGGAQPTFQYTTGVKGIGGAEGSWRDAEDSELSCHPIEQGSVDSTLSYRVQLSANGSAKIESWLCAGRRLGEMLSLHEKVTATGLETLLNETRNHWRKWATRYTPLGFETLSPELQTLYRRSLLLIRTQIDKRGAILAANDSDILGEGKTHYSYMWGRDGAIVANALSEAGYEEEPRRFFEFCRSCLRESDTPLLLQKYGPDGLPGAAWHPWHDPETGTDEWPVQQDSTALVLWALRRYYERHRDTTYVVEIEDIYNTFVARVADFMLADCDVESGLPHPSWDLWESRRGVHAFTCGAVFAGFAAASYIAKVVGDEDRAKRYSDATVALAKGVETHFWDDAAKRYARTAVQDAAGNWSMDMTHDLAAFGLYAFGVDENGNLVPSDKIEGTLEQAMNRLRVHSHIGGYARHEEDWYSYRGGDFWHIPGNPWPVTTLWAAQWHIDRAQTPDDLQPALDLLRWTAARAETSGVLAEQFDPHTGEPLTVSPLTWSHAEFVRAVLAYLRKAEQFPASSSD